MSRTMLSPGFLFRLRCRLASMQAKRRATNTRGGRAASSRPSAQTNDRELLRHGEAPQMQSTLRRSTLTVASSSASWAQPRQQRRPPAMAARSTPTIRACRMRASTRSTRMSSSLGALRRLELQREAGELEAGPFEHERGSFAGLFIQHSPQFRVVVQLTRGGPEPGSSPAFAGRPLAGQVECAPLRGH